MSEIDLASCDFAGRPEARPGAEEGIVKIVIDLLLEEGERRLFFGWVQIQESDNDELRSRWLLRYAAGACGRFVNRIFNQVCRDPSPAIRWVRSMADPNS